MRIGGWIKMERGDTIDRQTDSAYEIVIDEEVYSYKVCKFLTVSTFIVYIFSAMRLCLCLC